MSNEILYSFPAEDIFEHLKERFDGIIISTRKGSDKEENEIYA